jgi:hypothetical protein
MPLKIRDSQMKVFDRYMEDQFVRSLMRDVRTDFPEETSDLSDAEIKQLLRGALARARSHGIRYQSSIAGFVTLMFSIAPNFDDHPAFARVLDDPGLVEQDKLSALFSLPPDAWEQAAAQYDEEAWGLNP